MQEETAYINMRRYRAENDFLTRIVTIDESQLPLYSPPSKNKSKFWSKPGVNPPALPRCELHERQRMIIVGMDIAGVAFWDMMDENVTEMQKAL